MYCDVLLDKYMELTRDVETIVTSKSTSQKLIT